LLVIDLDGFKQVNDTFGHPAGDELLVHVAKRIRNNLRESDLVARVGGDEFIIMLEHTRFPDGMTKLAQKLLTIINEPILLQAGTTQVSGSIGIASYPEHADSASLLLKHADAAMYQAKLLGRNQYAMAADMTPPLTPQDQQNQQGHQAQPVQPAQQTQQPEQSQQPTPSQQQPSV
jgi:diguanylate cyclase (GGDEF)-like protein